MVLVTAFGCAERFVGFLYRVFLSRTIGAEALAVYQIALSVVGVIITLTASGIPITVSRLMLKERAQNNACGESEVVSAGVLTSLLISLPLSAALYFLKAPLSALFTDERCYDVLLVILPGITITSVYAVIRGYFWGNRRYFTYALIEFIEESVMAVAGVILVLNCGTGFDGAIAAGRAVLISYVVSFTLATLAFVFGRGKIASPIKKLAPLIASSSPITATRTLTSLSGTVVALLVPARLIFYGAEKSAAMTAFGELSGMAMPLLFIPSTIIGSIALVLVPEITQTFYNEDYRALAGKVDKALISCAVVSTIIIPVFIVCGRAIGLFVYDNSSAGGYLATSAIIMLPMSLSLISNSLLNSMNMEKTTFLTYLISAAAEFAIIWFAPSICGIYSLIIAYFVSFSIVFTLNAITLKRTVKHKLCYYFAIFKCTAAAGGATVFGLLLSDLISALPTLLYIVTLGLAITIFNGLGLLISGVIKLEKGKLLSALA